jgi:hypothetical protein
VRYCETIAGWRGINREKLATCPEFIFLRCRGAIVSPRILWESITMRRTLCSLVSCLGILLVIAGCGSISDGEDDAGGKKASKKDTIKIDPLAGKLGVFDDGRIEVPLPKGWSDSINEENSDKDLDTNLARMARGDVQRLPGIMVRVREYDDFKTLGESDLRKFVRKRNADVPKEKGFKNKLDVKPISLRGFHGAEYAYTVRISGNRYERLTLETVVDGRLYTLELTTLNALREEARPALYAVATGMKFPKMVDKPSSGRDRGDDDKEADGDAAEEKEDEEKTPDDADGKEADENGETNE